MKTRRGRWMVVASSLVLFLGLVSPTWATGVKLPKCGKMRFPASGQTTPYTADTQTTWGATVPDDGTVQAGATLRYHDNGDGTITDFNTGLVWEKKCSSCGGLHDVINTYYWSSFGDVTIWDWLGDVNIEGGTGFAGHNDWRIPNVKELQSIVDYEVFDPSIAPIFGDTGVNSPYWSASTVANDDELAWVVLFSNSDVNHDEKYNNYFVRAVRGGCL